MNWKHLYDAWRLLCHGGVMMKVTKVMKILLALLAGGAVFLFCLYYYFFVSLNHLPKGDLLTETVSPNGDYTLNIYLINGGATVSYAVKGEVVYHKKKDKRKNIYWQYREQTARVIWSDHHTISINGVQLDVRKDVYDYRRQ
jgi:hypothetical protein